jgi:hypothetical protein
MRVRNIMKVIPESSNLTMRVRNIMKVIPESHGAH